MLSIEPIKAFEDNYIWLLTTNEGSIVIDPGESSKIKSLIDNNEIDLKGILITHHHYDHTNGLNDLSDNGMLDIYGPENNIVKINKRVKDSDCISIIGLDFEIIEVPGHTLDHIAFYSFNENMPILFCGDTLFSGGCGRVFEGTHKQMYDSLNKLASLPKHTKVYCGHEYTLSNLKFAIEVDTENKDLLDEYNHVKKLNISKNPSLPSTLDKELKINPFLRCNNMSIRNKINKEFNVSGDDFEIFTALREWKDNY
jgi:hydroxyacylglutathione hydrolase|tara:strand:+ start:39 stop:803 length:765 start_codon:yes stop_codon:yes gene_type:complete